jgi:membrane-bound lytic murein transglycosylase A
MMMKRYLILAVIPIVLFACAPLVEKPIPVPGKPPVEKPVPPESALLPVSAEDVPSLSDDLDPLSLETAVSKSLLYFSRLPEKRTFQFGKNRYTLREMRESLLLFLDIMRSSDSPERKEKRIRESFDFFKASGAGEKGKIVIFTGYYEPILEGSVEETDKYQYPVYEVPSDLLVVHLGKFKSKYAGERIVGRVSGREVVPYYSRRDIDSEGSLERKGHEIVWLSDPVDAFFLHIQGSGMVRLSGGGFMQISYAGANGRPNRMIGKLLLDEGMITAKEMSAGGIKKYLREHPEEMTDILNHNESYVFFRIVEEGPIGAIGVPLTGGRSIATDLRLFPRGALSFVRTRKPLFDDTGGIRSWVPFSRFAVNQDTGGVIKGPGRVDLFCGRGAEAEMTAGGLKEEGDLYFLVKKKGRKR